MNLVSHAEKDIKGQQTSLNLLEKIIPVRERWRFEALNIISDSGSYITSYEVTKRLNTLGLKTRVSSVHAFLDTLMENDLCKRDDLLVKVGYRGVIITEKGKRLVETLRVS